MSVKLESGFELIEYSDLRYEIMTIEVQYKGEQIAQLNIDKGCAEVELFTEFTNDRFRPIYPMVEFLDALNRAEALLKNYRNSARLT